jgi:hypothetical protein
VSDLDRLRAVLERHRVDHDLLSTPGGAWAVMVPRLGARILGAGVSDQNALWVSPFLEACLEGRNWNAGGQRTWVAPEAGPQGIFGRSEQEWVVPPRLDPGFYRRTSADAAGGRYLCSLELPTVSGTTLTLAIERALRLEDLQGLEAGVRGVRILFEHTLTNRGTRSLEAEVGLWSILQVPALPEGSALLPATPYRVCYGEVPEGWARIESGRRLLRTAPARRYKVGLPSPGPEATVAHLRPAETGGRHIAVVKRTPVAVDGRYVDRPPDYADAPGDVLQVYNSPLVGDEAFCELECHAPAPLIAPGQEQSWPVEILILEGPEPAILPEGLLADPQGVLRR